MDSIEMDNSTICSTVAAVTDETRTNQEEAQNNRSPDNVEKSSAENNQILTSPEKALCEETTNPVAAAPPASADSVSQVCFSVEVHHEKDGTVICRKCTPSKVFNSVPELLSHHFATHAQAWSYDCKTCDATFESSEKLWSHQKECTAPIHVSPSKKAKKSPKKPVKMFPCGLCNLSYFTKKELSAHLKSVSHDEGNENMKTLSRISNLRANQVLEDADDSRDSPELGEISRDLAEIDEDPVVIQLPGRKRTKTKRFIQEIETIETASGKVGQFKNVRHTKETTTIEGDSLDDDDIIKMIVFGQKRKNYPSTSDLIEEHLEELESESDSNKKTPQKAVSESSTPPKKRGRGRPRKNPIVVKENVDDEGLEHDKKQEVIVLGSGSANGPPKRMIFTPKKRGRPRKTVMVEEHLDETENDDEFMAKLEYLQKSKKVDNFWAKEMKNPELISECGCQTGNSFRMSTTQNTLGEIAEVTCLECLSVFSSMEMYLQHSPLISKNDEDFVMDTSAYDQNQSDHCYSILEEDTTKTTEEKRKLVKIPKKLHLCTRCGKLLPRLHVCEKSAKGCKYTCDKCTYKIGEFGKLQSHMAANHQTKVFKCPVCKLVVTDSELDNHFSEFHEGVEYFKFHRGLRIDRKKHEEVVEKVRNQYKKLDCLCNYCGRRLYNKGSLRDHIISAHTFEYPFRCEGCQIGFTTKHLYKVHLRKHDGGDGKYVCPYCDRKFTLHRKRHTHISQKHGETLQGGQCTVCLSGFATKDGLKKHYKRFPEGSCFPKCSICNKDVLRALLPRHERSHTDARFQCTLCPRSFVRGYMLNDHYDTHTELKRFNCDQCNKGYFTKAQLLRHASVKHYVPTGVVPAHIKKEMEMEVKGEPLEAEEFLEEWLEEDPSPEATEDEGTEHEPLDEGEDATTGAQRGNVRIVGENYQNPSYLLKAGVVNVQREDAEEGETIQDPLEGETYQDIPLESRYTTEEWLEEDMMVEEPPEETVKDPIELALLATKTPAPGAVLTRNMLAARSNKRVNYFTKLDDGSYKCTECHFTRRERHHVYVHHYHRHRPKNQAYMCPDCDFQTSNYLEMLKHGKEHKLAVTKECEICGKKLSSLDRLKDHMNIHTGNKPHVCKSCGAAFAARNNMLAHKAKNCPASLNKMMVKLRREPKVVKKSEFWYDYET